MTWQEAIQKSKVKAATRVFEKEEKICTMVCYLDGIVIVIVIDNGIVEKQESSIKDEFTDWRPSNFTKDK